MIEYLIKQLNSNPFFFTAFVASIVTASIVYFKSAGMASYEYIKRQVVFSACVFQNDPLYSDFEIWFYANYGEKYRNVEASVHEGIRDDGPESYAVERKKHKVYYKQSQGIFLIKYKGKRILISKGREKLEHATDTRSLFFNQYHFYAIRGAATVKALLEEAVSFAANKSKANELKIFSNDAYSGWDIASKISSKSIDKVILADGIVKKIVDDLDYFVAAKAEYERRNIFYKRGYGFVGLPGNGKTSIALAMATYLSRDVYALDLNVVFDNSYVQRLFANVRPNAVLLIEDIDGYFVGREPVKKDSKVSFSTLLNCIDGAFYKEGLITIITTNKKESLDPALIRAGRIDMLLEIPRPGREQVENYLNMYYDVKRPFEADIYYKGYSMCDIQEICLSHQDYDSAHQFLIK